MNLPSPSIRFSTPNDWSPRRHFQFELALDPRNRLQCQHERMRPLAPVALSADGFVELLRQAKARQAEIHFFGLGQGDAHIFDEMLDIEAGLEVTGHDARAQDFKGLAAGG